MKKIKYSNFKDSQGFSVFASLIAGILIGFANGFFGGGGGMICVPLLLLLGLNTKKAHATTLLVMLPVSIASSLIYITEGFFDFDTVLFVLMGCVAGGAAGALLLKKLKVQIIQYLFAVLVIAAGVRVLLM